MRERKDVSQDCLPPKEDNKQGGGNGLKSINTLMMSSASTVDCAIPTQEKLKSEMLENFVSPGAAKDQLEKHIITY